MDAFRDLTSSLGQRKGPQHDLRLRRSELLRTMPLHVEPKLRVHDAEHDQTKVMVQPGGILHIESAKLAPGSITYVIVTRETPLTAHHFPVSNKSSEPRTVFADRAVASTLSPEVLSIFSQKAAAAPHGIRGSGGSAFSTPTTPA